MITTEKVTALAQAIEAEIAALDRDDLDALAAATAAKLALIESIRAATPAEPAPAALVEEVRALNREAGRRINLARAAVERRLARISALRGAQPALTYGPDGRTAPPR